MTLFFPLSIHASSHLALSIQPYGVAILLILLVCNIVGTQIAIRKYQTWRRSASTRLHADEKVVRERDQVPLRFVCDQSVNSTISAGVSLHGKGRIVLSNRRLLVGTSIGRILEISRERKGSIRALGPKRLLLWGRHPSDVGKIRIELTLEDEKEWESSVTEMIKKTAEPLKKT